MKVVKKMLRNLRTVERWYQTEFGTPAKPALRSAFETGLNMNPSTEEYPFRHIYIPLAQRVKSGDDIGKIIPGEYEYIDIGLTMVELVGLYYTQYRERMICEPLTTATAVTDANHLGFLMYMVYLKNKYKYLKWIDSMGYAYNPIWNVDADERYQSLDNHGGVNRTDRPILATTQEQYTADYNSTPKKTGWTQIGYNNQDPQVTSGFASTSQETHENAKNKDDDDQEKEYVVESKDAAFGQKIIGGDYMHVEKRLRQGNIGVTKSTDLIISEREAVRFNLIQEYFNDINKEILMGLYPNFN